MNPHDIKLLIEQNLPSSLAHITSEDNVHFFAEIISPLFKDKSTIAQHRLIYNILDPHIKNGDIHAISLRTYVKPK